MKAQKLRLRLREATWNAILDATENVTAEEGSAASLQAIAERAGIAVGTIYNYFDDKVELLEALFKRRREELYEVVDDAAKKHARAPFEEQLAAFVAAVFAHFDARRAFLRIVFETESLRPLIVRGEGGKKQPAMQQLHDRAARILKVGVRERVLRDEPVDFLATVLVSIVRGVLIVRSQGEQPFFSETERVVSLFLGGASK